MNANSYIYAPRWVKAVALVTLGAALAVSLLVVLVFLNDGARENWVLVALSLAQIAASGLVISLVVFFSQRDVNMLGLRSRTERFLVETIPEALMQIDRDLPPRRPWTGQGPGFWAGRRSQIETYKTKIDYRYNPGEIECLYFVETKDITLLLRVQLNIGEVVLGYYFPCESEENLPRLRELLDWSFSRLVNVTGYKQDWYWSTEAFDGKNYAACFLTHNFGKEFLDDYRNSLFMVNDLALNTRGLLKECRARSINTSYPDVGHR